MATQVSWDDVEVGTEVPAQTFPITRMSLVMYCGASGDFNVIHWNEKFATQVGLPGVIAHGMYTMAEAARVVTDWVGDPGAVLEYGVRFSKPLPVPDDFVGTPLAVTGRVVEKLDGRRAVVELVATIPDGVDVLSNARATVQLA